MLDTCSETGEIVPSELGTETGVMPVAKGATGITGAALGSNSLLWLTVGGSRGTGNALTCGSVSSRVVVDLSGCSESCGDGSPGADERSASLAVPAAVGDALVLLGRLVAAGIRSARPFSW